MGANEERELKRVCLPFLGKVSYKLRNIFREKACVTFKYNGKLGNGMGLKKEGVDWMMRGLVYEVNCKECEKVYIGETGRCIKNRLVEHKADIRGAKDKNAIVRHVLEWDHEVDWGNVKLVEKNVDDWFKRRVMEGLWINRKKESIMNGNVGLQGLDGWNTLW